MFNVEKTIELRSISEVVRELVKRVGRYVNESVEFFSIDKGMAEDYARGAGEKAYEAEQYGPIGLIETPAELKPYPLLVTAYQAGYVEAKQFQDYAEEERRDHAMELMDEHYSKEVAHEWRATHTWYDLLKERVPCYGHQTTEKELAGELIKDYLLAEYHSTYAYESTINPEGISQSDMDESRDNSYGVMMAALSLLSDTDMQDVLQSTLGHDFDRSTYPVTDVSEVRDWQRHEGGKFIEQADEFRIAKLASFTAGREGEEMPAFARGVLMHVREYQSGVEYLEFSHSDRSKTDLNRLHQIVDREIREAKKVNEVVKGELGRDDNLYSNGNPYKHGGFGDKCRGKIIGCTEDLIVLTDSENAGKFTLHDRRNMLAQDLIKVGATVEIAYPHGRVGIVKSEQKHQRHETLAKEQRHTR